MASSVFYKFKSRKDESRITFDGTGISVFDLKREIILANNMGKANDFDLLVYDSSMHEYNDDATIIPRSSSVIVKRIPAIRPGKGKASLYIGAAGSTTSASESKAGAPINATTWHKGALSVRFDGKDDGKKASTSVATTATGQDEEAAAMAAMFQAQSANWEETQEKMSHATRVFSNTRGTGVSRGGKPHQPYPQPQIADRPLPPSYVCYRCGQKGHWINMCPTNNDREFDNRPRIKRTTGIPRSMLKAVETPNGALGEGIMVTPEGGYVVAQPDLVSWQKQVTKPKGLTEAEVRDRTPTDTSLVDPLDSKLLRDPVRTPCCQTAYSEENIQTHLLEHDFLCPNCGKNIHSLDKLVVDKPLRLRVSDYIETMIEESKKEEEGSSMVQRTEEDAVEPGQIEGDDGIYNSGFDGTNEMDKMQAIVDNIPHVQAQIQQLDLMRNASLPKAVRDTTELQYQDLQIQLQQGQTMAVTLAMVRQQHEQMMQLQSQLQQQQQAGFGLGSQMSQQWNGATLGSNQGAMNNRRGVIRKN